MDKKASNVQLTAREKFVLKHQDTFFRLLDYHLHKNDSREFFFYEKKDLAAFYKHLTTDNPILGIKDIPDGYLYAAVNVDGNAYAFKTQPKINGYEWAEIEPIQIYKWIGIRNSANWRKSLISIDNGQVSEKK